MQSDLFQDILITSPIRHNEGTFYKNPAWFGYSTTFRDTMKSKITVNSKILELLKYAM